MFSPVKVSKDVHLVVHLGHLLLESAHLRFDLVLQCLDLLWKQVKAVKVIIIDFRGPSEIYCDNQMDSTIDAAYLSFILKPNETSVSFLPIV